MWVHRLILCSIVFNYIMQRQRRAFARLCLLLFGGKL